MKTTVFFVIASLSLLFLSCAEEPQAKLQSETNYSIGQGTKYDISELDMVYSALDSLNRSVTCKSKSSRSVRRLFMVKLADQAGRRGGQWIGRATGASIGSLGGPGTACVGYLAGNVIGGFVGDVVSSALVECILDSYGYAIVAPNTMLFKADYSIQVSSFIERAISDSVYMARYTNIMPLDYVENIGDVDEIDNGGTISILPSMISQYVVVHDSLGYYHNSFMVSVNQNKDMYILNGKPDINRLYDDVLLRLMERGYDISVFMNNFELRNFMIEMIQTFGELGYRGVAEEMPLNQYVEAQCEYLRSNCRLTDEEISIYKSFDVKIVETCSTLSEDDIYNYSTALNELLDNAEISHELRINLAIGAQAAVNSALCWNQ